MVHYITSLLCIPDPAIRLFFVRVNLTFGLSDGKNTLVDSPCDIVTCEERNVIIELAR